MIKEGPENWPQPLLTNLAMPYKNTIKEYVPDFDSLVEHRQVVTPWDLQETFGLTEGNIFQGELTLRAIIISATHLPVMPSIKHRLQTCGCRALARIRVAVSWDREVNYLQSQS